MFYFRAVEVTFNRLVYKNINITIINYKQMGMVLLGK